MDGHLISFLKITCMFPQALVAHTSNLSYFGSRKQENFNSTPARAKSETLPEKYPTQKRAGVVSQVVQCLPSKHCF
jgi:hypothetical protein